MTGFAEGFGFCCFGPGVACFVGLLFGIPDMMHPQTIVNRCFNRFDVGRFISGMFRDFEQGNVSNCSLDQPPMKGAFPPPSDRLKKNTHAAKARRELRAGKLEMNAVLSFKKP